MTEPRWKRPAAAFLLSLAVFAAVAGPRLLHPSSDPHFVLQADAWLNVRLDIAAWPRGADDPAFVEDVELDDGSRRTGRRSSLRPAFLCAGGGEVDLARVHHVVARRAYVGFPPFPALFMLPSAALRGAHGNDVVPTVVLAALAPALLLVVLRRLREAGLCARPPREDWWFVALLAFGSVFFFSAVQGRVWYTAHVVAVDLCLLYVWASAGAAHPALAGLFLGCAFLTRAPMLFLFPLFLAESWRMGRDGFVRRALLFAAPVLLLGLLAAWHNHARFGEWTEFGHRYLAVRQQADIERYGLFHPRYVGRNLLAALALLPSLSWQPPYVSISGHGLALWFTTPALLALLLCRARGPFPRELTVTALFVAVWPLLYQNTGWAQFGYRFSLDFLVLLILRIAVGNVPLDRTLRVLVLFGIAVNLFGAVTFHRFHGFYRTGEPAYRSLAGE